MSSEWKEYSGELPAALQGLGAAPVHHADHFWMRLGRIVLVARTPPASIFPKGTWMATAMPSAESIAWHAPVKHDEWSVSQSTDGHYLRIDDHAPKTSEKTTHFYVQHTVLPLTLHNVPTTLHGTPRTLGAAPPASVFPPLPAHYRWAQVNIRWSGVQWGPLVNHGGGYTSGLSHDGTYLQVVYTSSRGGRSVSIYLKQQIISLHLHGVPQFVGATPSTEMQDAAMAMNAALAAHGYCQADMGLYTAFQKAAGLTDDGFPGRNTMVQLQSTVAFAGGTAANVTIYPWTADANGGGQAAYDGVNAPTWAQWTSCSGGPSPTPVVPPVVPPLPVPVPPATPTVASTGTGPLPYIIGAVVVAGALAAYTYSKKGRKH